MSEPGRRARVTDPFVHTVRVSPQLNCDTVIIDTAGRQVVDDALMKELVSIKRETMPDEVLLVVDSMTGQTAATITKSFNSAVGITGACLTKTDSDARGGAAVSIRGVSGQPIKFLGTGEAIGDLTPFFPTRAASKILGMGDVVTLVEQASKRVTEAEAAATAEKMKEGIFDFSDFQKQSKLMSDMGSMANMARMLPGGIGNSITPKQMEQAEKVSLLKDMYRWFVRRRANGVLQAAPSFTLHKWHIAQVAHFTSGTARTHAPPNHPLSA